jgi:outer membrane immunogenic protein
MLMKRFLIGLSTVASVLAATSALAADLAPRPYTKAPVIVDPGYNWTGFYAGLNGGYSWGRASTTLFANSFLATAVSQDVNGGLFGGQVGYNWQLDRKWVIGLEADAQWTGERSTRDFLIGPIPRVISTDFSAITTALVHTTASLPWFATFRGRVGFLADPSLLLYGTGGVAVGEVKYASQATATVVLFAGSTFTPPPLSTVTVAAPGVSESQTRVGWTAGAGVEKKFNQNWSAKAEYLYVDLGTKTYFGGTGNQIDVKFHDHIFRVGFNYAFSPMVVAKY